MSNEIEKRDRAVSSKVQYRIDIIKDYIATKKKRSQIITIVRDNHEDWKVSIGTIDSYIRKAKLQLIEDATQTLPMLKAEASSDLRYLYKKAVDEGDISEARRCRAELNKLYNLYGSTGIKREESGEERDVTEPEVQEHLDGMFKAELLQITNEPDNSGTTVTAEGRKLKQPGEESERAATFADLGL